MDAEETAERLGSTRYYGGMRDTGTGHIHPLKLVIGTARVAAEAGAHLFENTRSTGIASHGGKVEVTTPHGTITADKGLIAVNAYGGDLEPVSAAHVMPIGSFIGATVPLGADSPVLPGGESVDDSRFVVRYFRKSRDGRLLFGGREIYAVKDPKDIHIHIRRQITEIYPALKDVEITHGWGGFVGITVPRTAVRARGDAGRDLGRRLFRPRRHAVQLLRQALRRDGRRQPRPAEAVRGAEDPGLPRRAHASARRCCSWRSTGIALRDRI